MKPLQVAAQANKDSDMAVWVTLIPPSETERWQNQSDCAKCPSDRPYPCECSNGRLGLATVANSDGRPLLRRRQRDGGDILLRRENERRRLLLAQAHLLLEPRLDGRVPGYHQMRRESDQQHTLRFGHTGPAAAHRSVLRASGLAADEL